MIKIIFGKVNPRAFKAKFRARRSGRDGSASGAGGTMLAGDTHGKRAPQPQPSHPAPAARWESEKVKGSLSWGASQARGRLQGEAAWGLKTASCTPTPPLKASSESSEQTPRSQGIKKAVTPGHKPLFREQ